MTHSLAILNRIVRSPRWSEREARIVLSALAASRMDVADFARRHSIQTQRIYLWKRKLEVTESPMTFAQRPSFVEVAAVATAVPTRTTRYELVTVHGEALRIDGPVDAAAVRMLIAILRERDAC